MEPISTGELWISNLHCTCRPILHLQCWDNWKNTSGPVCIFCRDIYIDNDYDHDHDHHRVHPLIIVLLERHQTVLPDICIIIYYILILLILILIFYDLGSKVD